MTDPHITIVMATHNGEAYLQAQLDSLLAQTHANWSLVVSDDGSSDGTRAILRAFALAHPARNLRLVDGPGLGSAAQNFMALLTWPNLPGGLVALCDQDDVWLPAKLARAVGHLDRCPPGLPAIYASESTLTDANLRPVRQKVDPRPAPGFRNALVQNLFAGHSTVLNAAALAVVRAAGAPQGIAFHDWWLYQLIAGAGGACLLDPAEAVLYRQHGHNVFGASHGLFGALRRLGHLARSDYLGWLSSHWRALHAASRHLTPEAREIVADLLSPPVDEPRARQFRRLGLHRGSARGTVALLLAARLGRV